MLNNLKTSALAVAFVVAALSANAATVLSTGTFAGSTTFVSSAGGAIVGSNNAAYAAEDAFSNWVWDLNPNASPVTFTVDFDLSGYNASTASLSGLWGVDNYGSAYLNGTLISTILFGLPAFATLTAYSDIGASFNAGINHLTFVTVNGYVLPDVGDPGPAAFRATVNVTADVAPVPLPAGLPLLAGALGLLGLGAARRRRNTLN